MVLLVARVLPEAAREAWQSSPDHRDALRRGRDRSSPRWVAPQGVLPAPHQARTRLDNPEVGQQGISLRMVHRRPASGDTLNI